MCVNHNLFCITTKNVIKDSPTVEYQISVILGHIAVCTGMKYDINTFNF